MESIELLARVLAIPSTPEARRETEVAEVFQSVVEPLGLASWVWETSKGRGSFVASLEGTTQERVLLLAHLDVAPAESRGWRVPPFSGLVWRGAVWGRGAVDAKGLAVVWLSAMIHLHAQRRPLRRGLTLWVAAQEESGGVERGWCPFSGVAAFGEGGGYCFRWRRREYVTVQAGECGRVHFRAPGASVARWRGDTPYRSSATESLMQRVRLGRGFPLDVEAALFPRARREGKDSYVLTYPPSCDVEEALEAFCEENALRRENLFLESHEPPSESPLNGEAFTAVEEVVAACRPQAILLPTVTPGFSDNRFLRRQGVSTYGFFPFLRLETARRQHRPNERLPVIELEEAIRGATLLVERLCFG